MLAAWPVYENSIKLYLPTALSVQASRDIPWPVKWLFLHRHRKHIFRSNSLPNLAKIDAQLSNFADKLKGKWNFRHNGFPSHGFNVPRRPSTPPFRGQVDSSLQFLINHLRGKVMGAAREAVRRARWRQRAWSNTSGLEKLARKLLQEGPYVAIPNDKNARFSLVLRSEVPVITQTILESPVYLPWNDSAALPTDIIREYLQLCKKVSRAVGDPDLCQYLSKTAYYPDSRLFSTLHLTVKDHKDAGSVTCRPVHSTPRYKLSGLAAWIRSSITDKLDAAAPHLVRDSLDLRSRLEALRGLDRCHFLKVDIKDFYLKGTPEEILPCIMQLWDPADQLRDCIRQCIVFFFETQFVRDPSDGSLYKVQLGTGMGLPHSGELTDGTFWALMETVVLRQSVLQHHGILAYYRYRDDILTIAQGLASRTSKPFLDLMRRKATFYELKEEWGYKDIVFLDLEICLHGGRAWVSHFLKDGALDPPLSTISSHPPAVPLAWPRAFVGRVSKLCSTHNLLLQSFQILIDRLKGSYASPATIHVACDQIGLATSGRRNQKTPRLPRSWLTVDFHPLLFGPLQRALREFNADPLVSSLRDSPGFPRELGISWVNSAPNLMQVVRAELYGR